MLRYPVAQVQELVQYCRPTITIYMVPYVYRYIVYRDGQVLALISFCRIPSIHVPQFIISYTGGRGFTSFIVHMTVARPAIYLAIGVLLVDFNRRIQYHANVQYVRTAFTSNEIGSQRSYLP